VQTVHVLALEMGNARSLVQTLSLSDVSLSHNTLRHRQTHSSIMPVAKPTAW